MKQALQKTGLVLAGLVLPLAAVEFGTRVWVAEWPPEPRTHGAFRRAQPPPYRGAPYFEPRFLEEQKAHRRWYNPPGSRLVLPRDFEGRYYNIAGGVRRTAFRPIAAAGRLFVFGGSAVFCEEVPDEHTLPSRLQRELSGVSGRSLEVVNLGALTAGIAQQVERLRTVELSPGDLVVFYDGFNDLIQAFYHADPEGWIYEADRRKATTEAQLQRVQQRLFELLHRRSAFVRWRLDPRSGRQPPRLLSDEKAVAILGQGLARVFVKGLQDAHSLATAAGATFIHFLQPSLFTAGAPSPYERRLARNPYLVPRGFEAAARAGYPVLRRAAAAAGRQGISSFDLSGALDGRPAEQEVYLDYCHVNHVANEILARRMVGALQEIGAIEGDRS